MCIVHIMLHKNRHHRRRCRCLLQPVWQKSRTDQSGQHTRSQAQKAKITTATSIRREREKKSSMLSAIKKKETHLMNVCELKFKMAEFRCMEYFICHVYERTTNEQQHTEKKETHKNSFKSKGFIYLFWVLLAALCVCVQKIERYTLNLVLHQLHIERGCCSN